MVTGVALLVGTPIWVPPPARASPTVSTVEEDPLEQVSDDPLKVVIHRLTPGSVPTTGRVTVTGEIRNRSTAEWKDLNVYLVTSAEPITTRSDLAAAVESDHTVEVGSRIVDPGLFGKVPDLDPGESTRFRLSVPRSRLGISGAPGVYWLAVHVLGAVDGAREEGADGRARTFLPLVPPRNAGTEVALGLQVRNHTVRAADGRLEFLQGWQQTFQPDGRLGRLLGLGRTAGDFPLTWVVDPAVLEAARSVGAGNPGLDLAAPAVERDGDPGDDPGDDGGTTGGAHPSVGPSEPGGAPGGDKDAGSGTRGKAAQAEAALNWLEQFAEEAADRQVLALPFADLDVASAVEQGSPELVDLAFGLSGQLLEELSVGSTPVVVPPAGLLSSAAIAELPPEVPLVLSPGAFGASADGPAAPVLERSDGGRLVVAASREALWGPRPGFARSALAVRQRLLADAALHALSPDADEPLVRLLPYGWNPGKDWERARFFRGLDVPWLSHTSLASLLGPPSAFDEFDVVEEVDYPEAEADEELPFGNFVATEGLIDAGKVLEELLTDDTVLDEKLTRQALLTVSVWSRERPGLSAERARGAADLVDSWLERITVRGPSFVTMSSETGTFQVTLVNGLAERVTVGLRASVADDRLELTTPDVIQLPPRGRGAMRIDAVASDIGIHLVTLQPVSSEGTALGGSSRLSIRSSNVGLILWVVMAVGGAALFAMIAFRIVRRILQRRRTHGPLLKGSAG